MALTRNVKETVRARMERDPGFRQALLEEGIERLLAGEVDLGKAVLRDYVNATIGFQELGDLTAEVTEEPHADAGTGWESTGAPPVQDHQLPAGTRGLGTEGSRAPVSAWPRSSGRSPRRAWC